MNELDISARERRTLLRMSTFAPPAGGAGLPGVQHLDGLIAAVHALLPFKHCVVLHQRLQQAHTLAFVYQRGPGPCPHIGVTRQGDPPLRIDRYLQSFSRFGTFQNAFFWFHKGGAALLDSGVAGALSHAELSAGIAGGVNIFESRGCAAATATLIQMQYSQEQFVAKHLVFANLIARQFHRYFEQGESKMLRIGSSGRASPDGAWPGSAAGRTH